MQSIFYEGKEYRAIPQCDKLYISSDGEVISTRPRNGHGGPSQPRRLVVYQDRYGYLRISAKPRALRSAINHPVMIHTSLLSAWVRLKERDEVARHLNGICTDNRLCNLVWGTERQNNDDKKAHGKLKGESNPASKLTEADVGRLRDERRHKPMWQIVRENPQWSKFAVWAAVTGYTWPHLPGAVAQGRRCSKDGWKSGIRLRT